MTHEETVNKCKSQAHNVAFGQVMSLLNKSFFLHFSRVIHILMMMRPLPDDVCFDTRSVLYQGFDHVVPFRFSGACISHYVVCATNNIVGRGNKNNALK